MSLFETLPLEEVATLLSGGTPSKANPLLWDGEVPWLTPKDMSNWTGRTENTVTAEAIRSGTRLAPAHSIYVAVRGMSLHNEIRIIHSGIPLTFNQDIKAIVAKEGLEPRFLYFALSAAKPQLLNWVSAAGHGTGVLSTDRLKCVPVPNISTVEQTAIASILGALDDKIELNRRMNETLEAMARAIFKDWFVDFGPTRAKMEGRAPYLAPETWSLFPDRLDDEGKPEGWTGAPLAELVEVNPSERLARGSAAPYLDMASIPTAGPNPDPFVLREFGSGMRFRNGDALLARITPCLENGKTAFIQNLPDGEVGWGSTEFIVLRSRPPVPKPFAYLVARDPTFRAAAIRSMTGTSGRQRASNEAVSSYPLFKPRGDGVWIKLGLMLEPLFARIAANDVESRTLAATRDLLLPKLMSGEVRVREAEKLVGEAT